MAMTLVEFCKDQVSRKTDLSGVQGCAGCGVPLQETLSGNRRIKIGHVCSDCYFRMLGEELDQNPIIMPRPLRGA